MSKKLNYVENNSSFYFHIDLDQDTVQMPTETDSSEVYFKMLVVFVKPIKKGRLLTFLMAYLQN